MERGLRIHRSWAIALAFALATAGVARGAEGDLEPPPELALDANDPESDLTILVGMGFIGDRRAGFDTSFSFAQRIVEKGFATGLVPGRGGPLFVEAKVGVTALGNAEVLGFSAHLRWDLAHSRDWDFYALVGVGGNAGDPSGGGRWGVFPRVGGGAMLNLEEGIYLRGEASHELLGLGLGCRL